MAETQKKTALSKYSTLLTIIVTAGSALAGAIFWHYDTFVLKAESNDAMAQIAAQNDQNYQSLKQMSQLQYLEVIILLETNELRSMDRLRDAGHTFTAEDTRRYATLQQSLSQHNRARDALLGLGAPTGVVSQ